MHRTEDVERLVIDDPATGVFTVHRDVFRDADIFALEMRHIFESTWVFLGLDSQVPNAHDYLTTTIGQNPVVVSRDGEGHLQAFFNTCRHRGAIVFHKRTGNGRTHVCQYHGWAYDSGGKLRAIKDQASGAYSDAFAAENHDLVALPRFASYRGFLFGSMNPDVVALDEFLGGTRFFLDLIVDQGPHGIEAVPGYSTYTYRGNWKLQLENGLDAYHLTSTHPSFMKIVERRNSGESAYQLKAVDFAMYRQRGGFTFEHGHAALYTLNPRPEIRPMYAQIDEVRRRVGDERAEWMLRTRNLVLFPNVQFAENASLQLRIIRPLAPDLTEMTIFCLAPVGEDREARRFRLRQFEDFFNSSGLATPDDTACYQDCQTGYQARPVAWQQGYARGMRSVQPGTDAVGRSIGIEARTSQSGDVDIQDETLFHAGYREWLKLMKRGVEADAGARHD